MNGNESTEHAIGNLDARMVIMESRMSTLETRIDSRLDRMEESLGEVHAAVISARGAWRAIAWMAGIAGAFSGLLATFIHWFMSGKP